jgi:hypothetical protein
LTLHGDTARMPDRRSRRQDPPLASYVLRVTGRPAVLRYELHDVRTGERRSFLRADTLVSFLRRQGLDLGDAFVDPGEPSD